MKKSLCQLGKYILVFIIANIQLAIAQSVDELQKRLDEPIQTRSDVVEIDLSTFKDLDRKRPLYVRNGGHYVFTNGTLKRTEALNDSALLVVSSSSSVELGKDAVLSGGNRQNGHELVLLETGHLKLSSGEIREACYSFATPKKYDYAVLVKTPNSAFEMTGGKIIDTEGVCNLGGQLSFSGGSFVNNGTIESNTIFDLAGSVAVPDISLKEKAMVRLTSSLEHVIHIWPTPNARTKSSMAQPDNIGDYEGIVVAEGKNYTITEGDVAKISCPKLSSDKWKFVLENNQVVIRSVTSGIVDAETLQEFLDKAPAGTASNPVVVEIPEEGIELDCFIRIPENKHFRITGGSITVKDLQMGDFAFNVGDGASLVFDNILLDGGNYKCNSYFMVRGDLQINQNVTFRNTAGYRSFYHVFKDGKVNVYGGTISGVTHGVWNEGTFNLNGGTFTGCEYGIYNKESGNLDIRSGSVKEDCTYGVYSYSDFRVQGNLQLPHVFLAKGVCMRIAPEIKNGWVVNFIDNEFVTDSPVVAGDGRELTDEDMAKIRFVLPEGYESYLSASTGSIHIRGKGFSVVRTKAALMQAIQEAEGTCAGEPSVIRIEGEIAIETIYIRDKSIKLVGGTLKRAAGYTDGLFMLDNACLTLENIVIDGNKGSYTSDKTMLWPPFSLGNNSKLTINEGTEIRNHRVYNSHLGMIWATSNDKTPNSVVMNGGSIHSNEVPLAELITDNASKRLSLEIKGGTIERNTTGYGVASVNSFVMSAGTIGDNIARNFYNIAMQVGKIGSGAVVKAGQGGWLVYADLKIEGDGTNIVDSVVFYDQTARISRNAAQKSELILNHYQYNSDKLADGTVVVAGCDGYQLTEADLNKYIYKNNEWKLELVGNTIVLKKNENQSFGSGDDLQDFLDGLMQSGSAGTEQKPVEISFTNEPIRLSHSLRIPEGAHLLFTGASFARENSLKAGTSSGIMLEIPANASLSLRNTTLDGGKKEVSEALVVVKGELEVENGSVIKGGDNKVGNLGSAVYVASSGRLTISGGSISDNVGKQGSAVFNEGTFVLSGGSIYNNTSEIGNIVNYEQGVFTMTGGVIRDNKVTQACGGVFSAENSRTTLTGGEISSNEHCNVYTWSDVNYGGSMKVSGLFVSIAPSKVLISSVLRNNLELGIVADPVVSGTVVAQGAGGYKLTEQDLAKISCPDEKWMYVLRDGNIVLTENGSTSVENIQVSRKAYMENGYLVLVNQKVGTPYFVYSFNGRLIHTGKIASNRESCLLQETGFFIVKCGKDVFKVVNYRRN